MQLFVKICSALEHVHSKGFLHNDIKSNNVVLDQTGPEQYNPVLIDFGKSTRTSAATTITVNERSTDGKRVFCREGLAEFLPCLAVAAARLNSKKEKERYVRLVQDKS